MGQNWKTLSAVVLGAALAGWVMVRLLTGGAHREPAADAVAVVESPRATRTPRHAAPAERSPTAAPAPSRAPATSSAGTGGGDADDAAIARDLDVLAQALVRDQRIEDRLLPRIDDALDVPGVTAYRRGPDFWEPALAGSEGANR